MPELALYLPPFLRDYAELRETLSTEELTVGTAWTDVQHVWDEQFIQTCSETGISHWERMMQTAPEPSDSLQDRRFRILVALSGRGTIQAFLDNVCGTNNYFLKMEQGVPYRLTIGLAVKSEAQRQSIRGQLLRMLPANLDPTIRLAYNQHCGLSGKTHTQLHNYTQNQIRWEVPI